MTSVSIILPAYNEERRIGSTLQKVIAYLDRKKHEYEIIVVDDGSTDATVKVIKQHGNAKTRIVRSTPNRGKGYAVSKGLLEARYEYVLFSDSDLATPIEELEPFLRCAKRGTDIVIASRNMKKSRRTVLQPIYRRVLGRLFPLLASALVVRGFSDTQCGFKLFKADAAHQIGQRQVIERFAFDVEMLFLARQLGYTVKEMPVVWTDQQGTKVRPLRDGLLMLRDIARIRYNHFRGRYLLASAVSSHKS